MEEIEGYARRLLERSGQERKDHPLPSRMFAALEKPPTNLRIIGDTPKGARGWYMDGTLCVPDETPEDEVEDTIGHELVHWILSTTLDGVVKVDQDTIDEDVLLCARCPAHAVQRIIREMGFGRALQRIVNEWGYLDTEDGFPLRLVIRATYLIQVAVILWVGRTRLVIGGGAHEMNLQIANKAREKAAAEYVQETGKLAQVDAVVVWPLRCGDTTAAVFVIEGAPSLR